MKWNLDENELSWLEVFLQRKSDAFEHQGALPPKPTPETLKRHQKQVTWLLNSMMEEWNMHEKDLCKILGFAQYSKIRDLCESNYDFKDNGLNTLLLKFCGLLEESRSKLDNYMQHCDGYILWQHPPQKFHIKINEDNPRDFQRRVFGLEIPAKILGDLDEEGAFPF